VQPESASSAPSSSSAHVGLAPADYFSINSLPTQSTRVDSLVVSLASPAQLTSSDEHRSGCFRTSTLVLVRSTLADISSWASLSSVPTESTGETRPWLLAFDRSLRIDEAAKSETSWEQIVGKGRPPG